MKTSTLTCFVYALSVLFLIACKDDDEIQVCDHFHWGYEDQGAPEHWGTCFSDCNGVMQSPINIDMAIADPSLSPLQHTYLSTSVNIINNGHTLQLNYAPGSILTLGTQQYELLQFHFHALSEHLLSGTRFPLEVHLVHRHAATGQLAVIGVLFVEGNTNPFLSRFEDNLPLVAQGTYMSVAEINVQEVLPVAKGYFTYAGSLTTPPCSEGVSWFMMKEPVQASIQQLQKFLNILDQNHRPSQGLFGRQVREFVQ